MIHDIFRFAKAVTNFAGQWGAAAIALVAAGALLDGVSIVLIVPLLTILFGVDPGTQSSSWVVRLMTAMPGSDASGELAAILSIFGVILLLRAIVLWARSVVLARLQLGFIAAQRVEIADNLAKADWLTLARLGHARVSHLMLGDIQRCGAGVQFLLQGAVATVLITAQAGVALMLSPRLTIFALALMLVGAWALSGLLRRSEQAGRIVTQANQELAVSLGRFLGGMKMAVSQNLQGPFVREFEHSIGRSSDRQIAFAGQQAALGSLWSLLAGLVTGMVVLVGHSWLNTPAPILLALIVLFARIAGPAAQLHLALQQIGYCLPAWHELEALKAELTVAEPAPRRSGLKAASHGLIRFDRVGFSYIEGKWPLLEVSFSLAPGEMLGLTGASGEGKTTVIDLLVGLIEPRSGRITVEDVPLREIDMADWRRRIAYIGQDPVLFNDSIRRNLQWIRPDVSEEQIHAAIKLAGASEWLARLPDGLDTVLGETGSRISGGERQRLALARAFLRQPALLILDEATAAIDIESERSIVANLAAMDSRPATIMIAHRIESLSFCDRIVRLSNGRIGSEEHGPRSF